MTTASKIAFLFLVFSLSFWLGEMRVGYAKQADNTASETLDLKKPNLTWDQYRQWSQLLGKHYLEQPTKAGGSLEILAHHFDDGTYQIQFRNHNQQGEYEDSFEIGEWGVAGDIYFTIFKGWLIDGKLKAADPKDPYNRDAYRIIQLNDRVFIYESLDGKTRYQSTHVANDFELRERKSL